MKYLDEISENVIEKILSYSQDPFADSSLFPVYFLCEMVRKKITIALSGDDADELLAGYSTYKASQFASIYRRLPFFFRKNHCCPGKFI